MTTAVGPFTVWLASYPRSGNTWTRAVLRSLTAGEEVPDVDLDTLGGGPIAGCRATIEAHLGFASSDLLPEEVEALRPACEAAFDAGLDRVLVRKIHDALSGSPGATPIVSPAATRAAVYLVRDPRDVAVSLAHFGRRPPARTVQRMADPAAALPNSGRVIHPQVRQRLGSWSWHVESWTAHDLFPVMVFRYEDLHADPVGGFSRLAAFVGITASRAEVAAAVEAARFERLRAREADHGFRERPRVTKAFFRRGVVGAWRDELPADLVRRIETDHAATMRRLGYRPALT